ncbi:MAG TPA: hypothetical protein VNT03_10825 [Baekduia sp.]|nr:hypothetical protein [Baekduia sp.]
MIRRSASAALLLALVLVPAGAASAFAPANDQPSAATVIVAAPATVSGTTVEATLDADEPAPLVAADDDGRRHGLDRSVWFTYTPSADVKLLADTCDANFTSHLDIYTGGPGAFSVVAAKSNDYRDCPGDRRSFAVKAGVAYFIRVTAERDGVRFPDGGNFHLQLTPQQAPVNDAFSDATPIASTGTIGAGLGFSTLELGEPSYQDDKGSIWYRLSPAASAAYTASVAASPTEVTLQVFESRGSTINRLRRLGSDYTESDVAANVSFNALKGHVYYLRLGTRSNVATGATLQVTTNTAQGLGLLVTPSRNTLAGVRAGGLKAVLSCARQCRLGVDLLVTPADAKRYELIKGRKTPKAPVRIGHVGGTLPGGTPTSVTVPLTDKARARLKGARTVHVLLRVAVRGAKGQTSGRPVTKRITLKG